MTEPHTDQQLTPAEIRLAQYGQRTSTWSTATYDSGTERALHEIALGLKAEVERLREANDSLGRRLAASVARIDRLEADVDRYNDQRDEARERVAELETAAARHAQVMQVIERACDKGYDPDRFELAEAAGIPAEQVAS